MRGVRVFLRDRKLRKLEKKLAKLTVKKVRVGILSNDEHSDGVGMVELAIIQQYGAPSRNIPARDFLIGPLQRVADEQGTLTKALAKAMVESGMSVDQALNLIGLWGVSKVKQAIKEGISPANAPATIAKKGSTLPLVDTGRLINAIVHEVS